VHKHIKSFSDINALHFATYLRKNLLLFSTRPVRLGSSAYGGLARRVKNNFFNRLVNFGKYVSRPGRIKKGRIKKLTIGVSYVRPTHVEA